jgi:hypothetical protein
MSKLSLEAKAFLRTVGIVMIMLMFIIGMLIVPMIVLTLGILFAFVFFCWGIYHVNLSSLRRKNRQ